MTTETETAPSVDELNAKLERLQNEVGEAKSGAETAKSTFADAAKADPTAVESLLELANAVKAAEATVAGTERAVTKCNADIAGIQYQEQMAGITEAGVELIEEVKPICQTWASENEGALGEAKVESIAFVFNVAEGTMSSLKPIGKDMPKPPKTGGGGPRGPRGTRNVTVDGEVMSCRDYVAKCGDEASPAAQSDLAGTWEGSPVSYTNEAKRLAAKKGDTFA